MPKTYIMEQLPLATIIDQAAELRKKLKHDEARLEALLGFIRKAMPPEKMSDSVTGGKVGTVTGNNYMATVSQAAPLLMKLDDVEDAGLIHHAMRHFGDDFHVIYRSTTTWVPMKEELVDWDWKTIPLELVKPSPVKVLFAPINRGE